MEFITDNWVWFLVGGIIILMTIIGYFAEKTDFGRKEAPAKEKKVKIKEEKPKKNKKKEKEEKSSAEILDEKLNQPEVQMALATDAILDDQPAETPETLTFEMPEVKTEEPIADNLSEELNAPFGDTNFNLAQDDTAYQYEEPISEDLNQPLTSEIEDMSVEEPIVEEKNTDIFSPDIELPDLDSLVKSNTSIDTTQDDDDVWKF